METEATPQAIQTLRDEAVRALEDVTDAGALEAWRVGYLGRRGKLTTILRGLGDLSPELRRSIGALGNQTKASLEAALLLILLYMDCCI